MVPNPLQQNEYLFRLLQALGVVALFIISVALLPENKTVLDPPDTPNPPPEITLTAQSAFMIDLATGTILYAKHPDAQLPIASITKLFTAAAVSEVLSEDAIVRISKQAVARGEGGLGEGEEWRMRDLADYTLIVSSNVGAEALAERAAPNFTHLQYDPQPTVARMNELARELGLSRTYFLNASGLDISPTQASAMSSTRDIALFLAYLYRKPELYSGTAERARTFKPLNAETLYAENTNDAIPDIPGLIFGKTGFTDLAGATLAILFELGPNKPVAAVVLGSSSKEARFSDMRALVRLAQMRLK